MFVCGDLDDGDARFGSDTEEAIIVKRPKGRPWGKKKEF